jgi:hypothetical protein
MDRSSPRWFHCLAGVHDTIVLAEKNICRATDRRRFRPQKLQSPGTGIFVRSDRHEFRETKERWSAINQWFLKPTRVHWQQEKKMAASNTRGSPINSDAAISL